MRAVGLPCTSTLYLDNSDLLSCNVVTERNEKSARFLVTDQFQLILVEPDSKKLGWAVVRFVGLLQVRRSFVVHSRYWLHVCRTHK